jgi:hypothetical protein
MRAKEKKKMKKKKSTKAKILPSESKKENPYSTLPLYSPSDLYRKFSLWNHRPILSLSLSLSLYPHII